MYNSNGRVRGGGHACYPGPSRDLKVELALPDGISPGEVIGKQAKNVRLLGQLSGGARFKVDGDARVAIVSARSQEVLNHAVQLLERQWQASKRVGKSVMQQSQPIGLQVQCRGLQWAASVPHATCRLPVCEPR